MSFGPECVAFRRVVQFHVAGGGDVLTPRATGAAITVVVLLSGAFASRYAISFGQDWSIVTVAFFRQFPQVVIINAQVTDNITVNLDIHFADLLTGRGDAFAVE